MKVTHAAAEVRRCREAQGLSLDALARCMVAHDFPIHKLTFYPQGAAENIQAMVQALTELEQHNDWQFDPYGDRFIDAAVQCMPRVYRLEQRLQMALALDAFWEVDPDP